MSYPFSNFPALRQEHVAQAKLFADRNSMVQALSIPRGGVLGEVGVAFGDFSEFLISSFAPRQFVAFDTFLLHKLAYMWGRPTHEIFKERTHRQCYEERLAKHPEVIIAEGPSSETLSQYPDQYFDLLYIDADHTYEAVRRDADLAARKINATGIVVFNDYIMWDHVTDSAYGVVPVVNELVVNDGWEVVAFALEHQMFCDIAIRRRHLKEHRFMSTTAPDSKVAVEPALAVLLDVYERRADLQKSFPEVQGGQYGRLFEWANGVCVQKWRDMDYEILFPHLRWYSAHRDSRLPTFLREIRRQAEKRIWKRRPHR
jgi:hypothetical protein